MSNEFDYDLPVDSPTLDTNDGKVFTAKDFSGGLTLDLTDDEIKRALEIIVSTKRRHEQIIRSKMRHSNFSVEEAMRLIDNLEDELVTRLAEALDVIATVDASPVFEGQPPIIELVGALPSHYTATYGMDHEKKKWEVEKATDQGEDFLGSSKLDV